MNVFCGVSCQAEDYYNRQTGSPHALETITSYLGMASVFFHNNQSPWTSPEFLEFFGQWEKKEKLSHLDLTQELKHCLKLCAASGFIQALFSEQFVDRWLCSEFPALIS